MKEINFSAISEIECRCTYLEQLGNVLWFLIESLEHDTKPFLGKEETAALSLWDRREMYRESLYLVFRDLTENVAAIQEQIDAKLYVEENAILPA